MEPLRTPPDRPAAEASAALLAKGALRRLAADRLEPTPENYARAYRREAGDLRGPSVLPARAQKLVEKVAARVFEAEVGTASADFIRAVADGQWDVAEHVFEQATGDSSQALAALIERIVRGLERGGQNWTTARRKVGIQRVLDAGRGDARRLQHRLTQLVKSWESDAPGTDTNFGDIPTAAATPAASSSAGAGAPAEAADEAAREAPAGLIHAAGAESDDGGAAVASAATMTPLALVASVASVASVPSVGPVPAAVAPAAPVASPADWAALVLTLGATLQHALPNGEGPNRELGASLAALTERIAKEGATPGHASALLALCQHLGRVLQHRHHLFDQLGKLTLELTASLTDLAENDSWVRGQAEAMRLKIEDGLTARGVRAVGDMLHDTRKRHGELRAERERARDALKLLINRMLGELGELGSKTGSFHESVGRYASVIEKADSLESLTGVVREMVEESHTVQSLVRQTQERLQEEHSKATGLSQRVNELEGAMKRLSDEVSTDQLTQISNRRGLMLAFETERSRMERTGQPLAIGLLDIDNFKRLNDELGHAAGDEALKSLAALITKTLRPTDRIARYGGEEFVVLLPETPLEEGQEILTRLQRALTGGLFMHKNKQVFVTFSAGVTGHRLEERIEESLERADQALYEAKRTGKNRTCVS